MTIAFKLALWAGIGLMLYLSLTPAPPAIPGLPSDPVKHAAGWAGLTLLTSLATRKLTFQMILLLALGNFATEVLQGLAQTGRSTEIRDWAWGTAGILSTSGLRSIVLFVHSNEPKGETLRRQSRCEPD